MEISLTSKSLSIVTTFNRWNFHTDISTREQTYCWWLGYFKGNPWKPSIELNQRYENGEVYPLVIMFLKLSIGFGKNHCEVFVETEDDYHKRGYSGEF